MTRGYNVQPRSITHRHSLGERYPQQWHGIGLNNATSNLAEPLATMSSETTTKQTQTLTKHRETFFMRMRKDSQGELMKKNEKKCRDRSDAFRQARLTPSMGVKFGICRHRQIGSLLRKVKFYRYSRLSKKRSSSPARHPA
jgi:hypothetical protein